MELTERGKVNSHQKWSFDGRTLIHQENNDFHKRTNFETENLNPQTKEIRKRKGCVQRKMKSKFFKIEYVGKTGRQSKIRIKEHDADLKSDFCKQWAKKCIIWTFGKLKKEKTSIRSEFD